MNQCFSTNVNYTPVSNLTYTILKHLLPCRKINQGKTINTKLPHEDLKSSPVRSQTPFNKLFWFDSKHDVVRAYKTPFEKNIRNIGIPALGFQECKSSLKHIFLPKRRLLFGSSKGILAT